MEIFRSGTHAGAGSFQCTECECTVSLSSGDVVPECSVCKGNVFSRASIFLDEATHPMPAHEQETQDYEQRIHSEELKPGFYMVFEHDEQFNVTPLTLKYTRVGRSVRADVRLEDPTVSRRHAIVVIDDERIEVLDDRSLNGVFLNGERVDRGRLSDGDEITIGCIEIKFIEKLPERSDVRAEDGNHLAPA